MSIPISQFIPPPLSPLGVHTNVSTSVSQFLPCKPVHLYHFSTFHIYALIYGICFSLSDLLHSVWWSLDSSTSLQMTQFRSFLWLSILFLQPPLSPHNALEIHLGGYVYHTCLFLLYCWVVFHGVDGPWFVQPFTSWRTSGVFPVGGDYKQSCWECPPLTFLGVCVPETSWPLELVVARTGEHAVRPTHPDSQQSFREA